MKKISKILLIFLLSIIVLVVAFNWTTRISPPKVVNNFELNEQKIEVSNNLYTFQDSWLKKNEYGLWEMYASGAPFELGYKHGILTDSLSAYQELQFVNSIKEMIPSESYLKFLKHFLGWFNRKLDKYILLEYQQEIYGISQFTTSEFDFIGDKYPRILNYHAAHDIGHALENMNLVECTAFMTKGSRSEDGKMLIGRNMDFSVGDGFAENKIVAFYKPEKGNKFAFVTWAGFVGAVSGMNDKGLVVTINAANSSIPTSAKTPVSLLAREVLQYASNIDEAYEIIKKRDVFVAELFLVGSASDNKTVIIEKSLEKTAVYGTESDTLIVTNHYQSEELKTTELNKESFVDGSSPYRMSRTAQLLQKNEKHSATTFAEILRDQLGLDDKNIGMGNEKAVNLLIAHHSVIFKPEELKMWVSAGPFQLGKYLCYDLNMVFNDSLDINKNIFAELETIDEDEFLFSDDYKNFIEFKKETQKLKSIIKSKNLIQIDDEKLDRYTSLNPNFFYTYYLVGECYRLKGEVDKAYENYGKALTLEIARNSEKELIEEKINLLNNN